ncbi:hypothetical protein FRC10_003507 [Ceratobasidium sp. 414]|nr:hypothetical protein FRC10_003507 [Ceratobasidium sp. 414]
MYSAPFLMHNMTDTSGTQGWVVNAKQNRLVWVPHDVRDVLLRPRSTAVISRDDSVTLDFSNAKLGEEWGQCFDSKQVPTVNYSVAPDYAWVWWYE